MSILALDYGLVRTGVAISDEKETYAIPLETVHTENLYSFLNQIVQQETISRIILGYPLSLKGHTNPMTEKVESLQKKLESEGFQVELFDERFSTKRASMSLSEAGLSGKKQKKCKDEMAAAVFLQDYLDSSSRDSDPGSRRNS